MDTALSSADNTDYEGVGPPPLARIPCTQSSTDLQDTFEDAPDTNHEDMSKPTSSTRSLTDRKSSTASNSIPQVVQPPALPPRTSEDKTNKSEMNGDTETEDAMASQDQPKSPLLTTHRLSTNSLDEVNLGSKDDESVMPQQSTEQFKETPMPAATKEPSRLPSRFQGFSAALPSVPWGPPPAPPSKSGLPSPQLPTSRKLNSPFSWLSRNPLATKDSVARSPPLPATGYPPDRRNTASSIATLSSNPEMMVSRLDDGIDSEDPNATPRKPVRNTLRDRFKMLRMREEAGITALEEGDASSLPAGGALAGLIGRSASLGLGIGSPSSVVDEKEGGLAGSPVTSPQTTAPPTGPLSSTINPSLAPGTVSGVAAAPVDPANEVDWDLWQNVVYEGPAAVARTSAEELNKAISSGIPSAIRGVVWQVLANSKNEDLEGVYRELVARGTDKDPDRNSASSGGGSLKAGGAPNGSIKEKESIVSSSSSIHSEHSTAATSSNNVGSPSPQNEKDSESMVKLQAALAAERKQKTKEDLAALQKLEKAIKRDMGARTSYSKYAVTAGLQDGLFGVCKAYALFDEAVGYTQGMNFLVMPLLFNMPEEEAFCLLVRLMNQYGLREMFIHDMPGLHMHLYQFERLLEDLEPALYCHLHRKGVNPQLYATQWFMTLFAYRFPLQLVLRVYDLILSEGLEGAILKFGVVLMQRNADVLLAMNDMSSLTNFLKERIFDVYIDQTPSQSSILESGFFGSSGGSDKEVYRADILVQDACGVKLTPEMLKTYTAEWQDKVRQEKEREGELESLRFANAALSAKVRLLEERAEKSDTEHVQIATDMVRIKVENEELQDSNESLKGQVEELKNVIQKQPEEVEQQLKEEMDRIMKRNIEVQNENRALEEQMADMEKHLVETKMQYAEVGTFLNRSVG
jgi:hypothetical protein